MYSVVLMAALTTGGTAPDCHYRGGCCGCYGGYGGCYGGGYGGGCCGCYGGGFGMYGGCWGGYGGWGGCYGGMGGGCYGGMGYGGYAYGGGYGYGGGYYGGATYPGNIMPGATGTGTGTQGEQLGNPVEDGKKKGTLLTPTRAKLVVELPADAKLYIDDLPMKTTSGVRSFNTPTLEPGQTYYYMVRAEVVRDGKPVTETRRILVRAGQTARASFKDMEAETVTTARAK